MNDYTFLKTSSHKLFGLNISSWQNKLIVIEVSEKQHIKYCLSEDVILNIYITIFFCDTTDMWLIKLKLHPYSPPPP